MEKVKFGEVAYFKTGKLNSNAAVENGKYPFFTCSPETLRIDEYAFDQAAILLAGNNAEGNFNVKYYEGKFNAYQRTYVITCDPAKADLKYIYYALKVCLQRFKYISQGTATKFLTAQILNAFEISIPELHVQKRIASVLHSLDNKIELNNSVNQNLLQQAQAIYVDMFISQRDAMEMQIMRISGDFYTLRSVQNYGSGIRLKKYRLFATQAEADAVLESERKKRDDTIGRPRRRYD